VASRSARFGVFFLGVALALGAQARLPRNSWREDGKMLVPRPEAVRWAALGFDSLLADYYWLRVVQVVGRSLRPVEQAPLIGEITRVVVALDPWVDHPYRFAAMWMSDDPRTLASANRILERGIAYHPRDWRNRFYLSFNHFYNLGDAESAARELERAVGLPGAPRYLGRLRARLGSAGGDLAAAAAYLHTLMDQEPDEWHRAEYERALVEIETERRARQLDAARARFQEENGFDIRTIDELAYGPYAVLFSIPPEPNGFGWELQAESGQIVSGYYRQRYRVHFSDPAQKLGAPPADGTGQGAAAR
jgi:hypothetical protein